MNATFPDGHGRHEAPQAALRRKRARFRAWHRGIKEMDLVLGRFADRHLDTFSDEELECFEHLLDCADQDIYDWLTGRKAPPSRHDSPLFADLKRFALAGCAKP